VDTLLDPYVRPADALSESERRIFVAAFAAPALFSNEIGRVVPVVLGRPVLLCANDRSDVLVVSFQPNVSPGTASGVIGPGPRLSVDVAPRMDFDTKNPPKQQILLPKEQLWFLADALSAGVTGFVVSEVTP